MSFTYRGLKAELGRHIVTGEEVDRQIQRLQEQTPRFTVITDRPTRLGDEVILDYAGFCDGEQFAGGTAQMQSLVLGSGMFIPGFEEQLVDKMPGEEVVVKVTFPQQYHSDALVGKDAEFRCKLHQIREKGAYELDDTFAKEVGGCETFEKMREMMAQSLQAYTDERGEMDLQDRLIRQAAATMDFTPSEAQVNAEIEEQMQNLSAQLAQQGLNLEMYCQFMNTTEEKLRADARANAEASVRIQAAIELIVELEGITATEEERGQALAMIARQNRMTVEQLKPYCDDAFMAAVERSVLTAKALRLVRDHAEVTSC